MRMGAILGVDTRKTIYEAIVNEPGLHLRGLSRRLKMKVSLVEYHVRELLKNGLIIETREDGYRRFYQGENPSMGSRGFNSRDRTILHFLRQDVPLRIILVMLELGGSTHKDILKEVPVSPSTLSYHIDRLRRAGIVERYRNEWGKGLRLKEPKVVLWLVMRGRFQGRDVVDGMISTFEEFY